MLNRTRMTPLQKVLHQFRTDVIQLKVRGTYYSPYYLSWTRLSFKVLKGHEELLEYYDSQYTRARQYSTGRAYYTCVTAVTMLSPEELTLYDDGVIEQFSEELMKVYCEDPESLQFRQRHKKSSK
jgi:hypothetical protein